MTKRGSYTYAYARPALTVDCAVFAFDGEVLRLLLIERAEPPFEGCWALPGGFVDLDETVDAAAERELAEETGLRGAPLEQLQCFSAVDRDPRERVVSIAFLALVRGVPAIASGSDARRAEFVDARVLPPLAFDHAEIVEAARSRLKQRVAQADVVQHLLPKKFPLRSVQNLHEAVHGTDVDRRNFRKQWLTSGLLVPTGELEVAQGHRAAQLYRFDSRAVRAARKD